MPRDSAPDPVDYDSSYDVLVIGGGVAGVCAAIAAARHGCSVALVQDRPVLGGNSSSEVRVNIGGADHGGARRHAREAGIVEALRLTDRVRNHEPVANGRINFVWDHVLLEAVWAEPRAAFETPLLWTDDEKYLLACRQDGIVDAWNVQDSERAYHRESAGPAAGYIHCLFRGHA